MNTLLPLKNQESLAEAVAGRFRFDVVMVVSLAYIAHAGPTN